ncbi:protoporphyrinogen/coproporphyrinogen oxidase [Streptomyces sp. NPDC060053]|uniref:protoporphyrinogen/coproporphyrinogen oxidase n=1 Tax=Streptomyces sp. NPDC060053 TaxID=3347047 RepID=UPI00367DCCC4
MIVIIGAGPAGLSAAHHLGGTDHLILEQSAEPGGLCRSFELDGVPFDLGGHAFFTRHEYVRELLARTSPRGLFTQQRQAWVHAYGTLLRYPFQSHLHGLPRPVVEECLVGLYEAASRSGGDPQNLREWIERSFGAGIARHFLLPYNEKLWAHPLDGISPDWTSRRVVMPRMDEIVSGALGPAEFTRFPNHVVTYPESGGFFGLFEGLADAARARTRRAAVKEVDARRRRVTTGDGEVIAYDALISTMPLDLLVQATDGLGDCCRAAARSLRHNSLHLVNLVVDRPRLTDMQRIYVADPAVPFHKLVLNSNSSDALRELPRFGIQAEISWSRHKPVALTGLVDQVTHGLRGMGVLRADDRITASGVVTLERAYPVFGPDTAAAREHLLACLGAFDIFGAGRFGEWLYINSDDAVLRGKVRAEEVLAAA